jgi:FkbM family methyltransferase
MLVKPGSVVYDIGANVGFLTVISARLTGSSGRVFAFEPLAGNIRCLEHNIRLNGFDHVDVTECALADRDGTALFLISKSPTWGELASVSGKVEDEIGRTEVTVCRLDSIVQQNSLPLPNLIKIDVEGSEVMVLGGAWNTIQKNRPILLIELHGTNAAIAEKLNALGYVSTVIGRAGSIVESHWNSHVVAFPAPCPELDRIQTGALAAR